VGDAFQVDDTHAGGGTAADAGPRLRAVSALLACVAGIALARWSGWPAAGAAFSGAIVLGGLSLAVPGRLAVVALLGAVALLGSGRQAAHDAPPATHAAHKLALLPPDAAGARRALVRATGVVLTAAEDPHAGLPAWERGVFADDRSRLRLSLRTLDLGGGAADTRGVVTLVVEGPVGAAPEGLVPGAVVGVTGWMHARRQPANPRVGRHDPRAPLVLRTAGWGLVEVGRSGWGLVSELRRLRHRAQAGARGLLGLESAGPDPSGAMLAALVLGQRDPGFERVYEPFRRVGVAHLLAISGLHLAILAAAAAWTLRAAGVGWRAEAVGVALAVAALLLLVPARTPIVRAGVMVLALLASRAVGRRHDPLAVLAWTASVVLMADPTQLTDLGFQLSFGLVAVLIALAPHAHAALFGVREPIAGVLERPPPLWRRALAGVWWSGSRLTSATVACWLVSLPVIGLATGLVSPWTVPATVLATPAVSVLLVASYASLAAAALAPPLAEPLAWVLSGLARWCYGLVSWMESWPLSALALPPVSVALAASATAVGVVLVRQGRRSRWHHWLAAGVVTVWAGVEVYRPLHAGPALRVDTLSVGDGSCHLVTSGREAVLWDCGSLTGGAGRIAANAARGLGVGRVRSAVLTHANLDHANGLPRAARELGVRTLYTTPHTLSHARGSRQMAAILEELERLGVRVVPVAAGDAIPIGRASARVLWPPRDAALERANDASLVARVESPAGGAVLLTADIGGAGLAALLDREDGAGLRCEAMELPHHGAEDRAARELLGLGRPAVVVQSAGQRRVRRDPWHEQRPGGLWLVTARDGAVWVELDADGGVRAGGRRRGELDP